MNSNQSPGLALAALLAGMLLALPGCDRDAQQSAGEKEAGRANVEAMSREHEKETPEPSAAALVPPRREVVSDRLPYAEIDDALVYGHFAFPADMVDPLPAIIVIHEWWGLNDNVRAMADRLAGEGYIVLAVDLFGGKTARTPEEARQLMLGVVENPDSAEDNLRHAYKFVKETAKAPRVASLGWCFGGGWSLNTALMFPDDLDAAVIYYGQVTDDEQKLRPLDVPILGLFGGKDRAITVDSVHRFETALKQLGKTYVIHVYPQAGHAFANPTGQSYDAAAAEDAWRRTLDFLTQYLGGESAAPATSSS
ncbi:MAG: alpha/beta fold hydrolase [Woeseiaceae bacterium]